MASQTTTSSPPPPPPQSQTISSVGISNSSDSSNKKQEGNSSSRGGGVVSHGYLSNRSGVISILPRAEHCLYTPFYCEENVWQLCDTVRRQRPAELSRCHVVFISNEARSVPLWRQRAGKTDDKVVTWDYHVLFMYQPDDKCLVFDLDSDLPFPTYFPKYVTETLRTDHILLPKNHRFFRVLPATSFLQKFASDRRHMRRPDGTWRYPPPAYPPIRTPEASYNLDEFISMDTSKPSAAGGTVYSLTEFVRCFYKAK